MTKPRRRQAGEGGISEYRTKVGIRYWSKFKVPQEDGTTREVMRRKTRDGRPMTTRKEAAEELREILAGISGGAYVTPQKMTVGQWLDQWLNGLQVAASTMASYRKNVRLHLKPALGEIQLARLTGARISALCVAQASLDLRLVRDDSLIFGDLNGSYLNPDRFSRRFTRSIVLARSELGTDAIPMIRIHDLRHTHASVLLAAGTPVKIVSERLGHATVTITLETYQHIMPGMQAEAASMFAALVGGEA
jgi:hypothetical protein